MSSEWTKQYDFGAQRSIAQNEYCCDGSPTGRKRMRLDKLAGVKRPTGERPDAKASPAKRPFPSET